MVMLYIWFRLYDDCVDRSRFKSFPGLTSCKSTATRFFKSWLVGVSDHSVLLELISVGLHAFFRHFFKKNDPIKLYGLVQKKIEIKYPGEQLWENNNICIDCGKTLADGSTNIVWQRQVQTNNLALKKINTHAKIATQQIFPNSDALQKDVYKKLGWVGHLTISCIHLLIEIPQLNGITYVLCSYWTVSGGLPEFMTQWDSTSHYWWWTIWLVIYCTCSHCLCSTLAGSQLCCSNVVSFICWID